MKRKNQFSTSNKYWLLILAIICIVLMGLSGFAESGKGPLSWAAGYTIVPMQKGINRVGMWIGDVSENFATLQEIKKENKELKVKVGVLDGKVFGADEIKALASLPPKEVLIAKMLGSMNAPISGFVNVLQGTIRNVVYALEAVRKQKESA